MTNASMPGKVLIVMFAPITGQGKSATHVPGAGPERLATSAHPIGREKIAINAAAVGRLSPVMSARTIGLGIIATNAQMPGREKNATFAS